MSGLATIASSLHQQLSRKRETCQPFTAQRVPAKRRNMAVRAATWDPEGLFKSAPQTGLIERKLMNQRITTDQEYASTVATFQQQQREELQKKREARKVPDKVELLVEYFLDTEAGDMEYEVARCRPMLKEDFFSFLDKKIGIERFATVPDEERLAELEGLRDYLKAAVEAVDRAAASVAAAPARLKKLLESKDKKATLIEMAGNGEIDQALIDLMDQNIAGAQEAGQDKVVEFMTKVKLATLRHLVKV